MIVNKRTGRVLQLGSAFPIERDLALYDRGYQFERYDLVILSIRDLDATRRAVGRLPLQVIEPTYKHGQVGGSKTMTDLQRWKLLEKLPCILPRCGSTSISRCSKKSAARAGSSSKHWSIGPTPVSE